MVELNLEEQNIETTHKEAIENTKKYCHWLSFSEALINGVNIML